MMRRRLFVLRLLILLPLFVLLQACAMEDHFGARPIGYDQLPGWEDEDHQQAIESFIKTCEVLSRNARAVSSGSGLQVSEGVWQSLCHEAKWARDNALQAQFFFEDRFVPFRINNNGKEEGLFTGYYEPLLYGSYRKKGDFKYPLYAAPKELKNSKQVYTHSEINAGALAGRGLEIVWVDDPVMKFFLQIQGSGRVKLTNGKEIFIGYAGKNGHSYASIGKIMREEKILPEDEITFFTIRQWLYDNPDKAFAMMENNPSYVFFKKRKKAATGATGVVLTPWRSIAVDSKHIPYGLPVYMEGTLPLRPQDEEQVPFNRLMIAQDTGGAIRGPVRADVFFGPGQEAEFMAGNMKDPGIYTLLVPKEVADILLKKQ